MQQAGETVLPASIPSEYSAGHSQGLWLLCEMSDEKYVSGARPYEHLRQFLLYSIK